MTNTTAFFVITAALTLFLHTHSLYLPKRVFPVAMADAKKRPFCNAFTGCGRKRSNLPALSVDNQQNVQPMLEESIGSLLELSAEPAVEDISRQIMSEAKLWEAIQEANVELSRARQESAEEGARNGGAVPCTTPSCFV